MMRQAAVAHNTKTKNVKKELKTKRIRMIFFSTKKTLIYVFVVHFFKIQVQFPIRCNKYTHHLPRSINAQTFYRASHDIALYIRPHEPTEEAKLFEDRKWYEP